MPALAIASTLIATSEAKNRFSLLLVNTRLFLPSALDTDDESCYVQIESRISYRTQLHETEEYGAPSERVLSTPCIWEDTLG